MAPVYGRGPRPEPWLGIDTRGVVLPPTSPQMRQSLVAQYQVADVPRIRVAVVTGELPVDHLHSRPGREEQVARLEVPMDECQRPGRALVNYTVPSIGTPRSEAQVTCQRNILTALI
jgi:hypothetical protein